MSKFRHFLKLSIIGLTFSAQANTLETSANLLADGKKLEALSVARTIVAANKSPESLARARLLTAQIYIQLGKPILAEDILIKAMTERPSDKDLELSAKNELGAISTQRGDYKTSIVHYTESLQLAKILGKDELTKQRLLVNLANAMLDADILQDLGAALNELRNNLAKAKQPPAELLIATAVVYRRAGLRTGQADSLRIDSLNLLSSAFTTAKHLGDDRSASLALGLQGELYMDERRWDEAIKLSEIALLYAQQAAALEAEYRWYAQIGKALLAKSELSASEDAYRSALTILSEVRRDLPVSSPRVFSERILPVYNGYADVLLRRARMAQGPKAAGLILGTVVDTLEELKKAEVEDYFAKECVVEGNQDRSLLLDGVAIVYPVFLDDRTEIILETKRGYSQFLIDVGRVEMTNTIKQFRLQLEDFEFIYNQEDHRESGQILEGWLIDPLKPTLEELNVDTLVIIPDGPLRTIPFAAFYDGESFLIERFALAATPAIRLTKASIEKQKISALIGGITHGVQGFSPLSFVGPELDEVASILDHPKMKNETFKFDQVEASFDNNQFSVVHFATHGTFSSDFRKSYILTYDDKLTMGRLEDALGDQTGLDMLVLSACETAAGDERAALGLAGVAIQAGASSALASLWAISDEGTASLIPTFYEGLYNDDLSKAKSLQRAQIKLLRDPQFNHPVFWAPYLLIGNWN